MIIIKLLIVLIFAYFILGADKFAHIIISLKKALIEFKKSMREFQTLTTDDEGGTERAENK